MLAALLPLVPATLLPAAQARAGTPEDAWLLSLGPGWAQVLDADQISFAFAELRMPSQFWGIAPWLDVETSTRERLIAIGAARDVILWRSWALTPSFGFGVFDEDSGFDLGSHIEFRSALQLSFCFAHGHRLGVLFGHISNASIGDRNPGTEIIKAVVGISFGGGNEKE